MTQGVEEAADTTEMTHLIGQIGQELTARLNFI